MENVSTIDERRSKNVRKRVFYYRFSLDWQQMEIEILFLAISDQGSAIVQCIFDCHLSGVIKERI